MALSTVIFFTFNGGEFWSTNEKMTLTFNL